MTVRRTHGRTLDTPFDTPPSAATQGDSVAAPPPTQGDSVAATPPTQVTAWRLRRILRERGRDAGLVLRLAHPVLAQDDGSRLRMTG